jgi:carboxyl-terminal processing protease
MKKLFSLKRTGLTFATAALLSVVLFGTTAATPVTNQEEIVKLVARQLPRLHITRKPSDEKMAESALRIFLDMLDYEHSYFLSSDIESFTAALGSDENQFRTGQATLPFHIYDVLKERVSNRVDYVDSLLEKGFDFTAQETYQWRRKDEPWPANQEEWNELWRKRIKNQYLGQMVSRTLATNEVADANETNATASVEAETPDTDAEPIPPLTPEEWIRKGYHQYLTTLTDNDLEWVLDRYLTSFARAFDPHTDYMSASSMEDFDIGLKLSLTGIGAMLTTEDGAAKIDRLIPGGPADRDGRLSPGDKIIAVAQDTGESVDVLHWPLRKTVRLIRGEKGTRVVLTVIRASDPTGSTIEKIDIIRDEVRLEEQAARSEVREILDESGVTRRFGVITLPEFYTGMQQDEKGTVIPRTSSHDVRRLLGELKEQNIEGVILDLRKNGGGLLSEAIETTGLFIDSGPVVQVYNRASTRVLTDDDPETVYDGPMIVLVSRQTASASEILAAALQDYGRAVVIGDTKTHGKGTVQSLTPLRNDKPALGTLKVTTATFYRIDGASTQLRGVVPDIVIPSVLDVLEIGEEHLPHALPWTKVFPSLYRRTGELDDVLPTLKDRSAKRLKEEPRYKAHVDFVNRMTERHRSREISLNLDERLAMAQEEREMQKLLDELESPEADADSKKSDVMLTEALQVLTDWINLRRQNDEMIAADRLVPVGAN